MKIPRLRFHRICSVTYPYVPLPICSKISYLTITSLAPLTDVGVTKTPAAALVAADSIGTARGGGTGCWGRDSAPPPPREAAEDERGFLLLMVAAALPVLVLSDDGRGGGGGGSRGGGGGAAAFVGT